MGFADAFTGLYTIAAWPMVAMSDVKDKPIKAVAGLGAGMGGAYYIFGNPLTAVQSQDFVTIAFMFGVTGVGYWATGMLVDKLTSEE